MVRRHCTPGGVVAEQRRRDALAEMRGAAGNPVAGDWRRRACLAPAAGFFLSLVPVFL